MPRSLWMGIRPKVKLKLHFLLNPIMLAPPSLISQPHAFSPLEHLHQFHRGGSKPPRSRKKKAIFQGEESGTGCRATLHPTTPCQEPNSKQLGGLFPWHFGAWQVGWHRNVQRLLEFSPPRWVRCCPWTSWVQLMALRSWSHLSHLSHLALLHVTRRSPQVATSLCLLAVSSFPLGAS